MKGEVNIYRCKECAGETVTIDVDDGTTPTAIGCRAKIDCEGMAISSWYEIPDPKPEPAWEWFKPSEAETASMSPAMLDHIKMGGLEIRKRP